jgi:hypothetical protein
MKLYGFGPTRSTRVPDPAPPDGEDLSIAGRGRCRRAPFVSAVGSDHRHGRSFAEPAVGIAADHPADQWRHPEQPQLRQRPSADEQRRTCAARGVCRHCHGSDAPTRPSYVCNWRGKQTWREHAKIDANDPLRSFADQICCDAQGSFRPLHKRRKRWGNRPAACG